MKALLELKDLVVSIQGRAIVRGVNLSIEQGGVHVLMGPNGSGKSTLAHAIMGHPASTITTGTISFAGNDITALSPDRRARLGLFLSFQNAPELDGVVLRDFLRQAYKALYDGTPRELTRKAFSEHLARQMTLLGVDPSMLTRSLNVGFSGGEKKRTEMLQLAVLAPSLAILDEIDSGLDIDALKRVCHAVQTIRATQNPLTLLIITHNTRLLDYLTPTAVHIFKQGAIEKTGGIELVRQLEQQGFDG